MYKFMTEDGVIKKGRTQVGKVKRPLAAVSEITKANQIAFFCLDEDCIIDKADPLADQILSLVKKVQKKTKIYNHKGTYRMRAWMIPGKDEPIAPAKGSAPFGRQGP